MVTRAKEDYSTYLFLTIDTSIQPARVTIVAKVSPEGLGLEAKRDLHDVLGIFLGSFSYSFSMARSSWSSACQILAINFVFGDCVVSVANPFINRVCFLTHTCRRHIPKAMQQPGVDCATLSMKWKSDARVKYSMGNKKKEKKCRWRPSWFVIIFHLKLKEAELMWTRRRRSSREIYEKSFD